jgi:putative DNA primase/helicase
MRKLAKEFDRAPHLLGTPGGIYDLRTGQRIEGDGREALVTKTTAVAPADKGRCPRFIAFLDEACGGDPDLVEHVVRALGYVLWGGNPEEVIVFLFGPGGNGKSVLVALMRWLLHEYAQTASMATFQEAQGDRASHDVAMLAGARLVAATETKKGRTWDEQRVNALTGGDMITARHLYGQFFSFMPQFLPLLAGNHKPALATVNEAVRRRFLLWPFTVQPAVKDTKLGGKLQAEGPAILRLLINECGRWHAAWKRGETNRLRVPEAVTEATAEYLAGQEPVARWVRDRCEVNAKALGKPSILHADYTAWMTGRGDDTDEAPLGLRAFRQALEDLGYGRKKINGEDFWGGLRLKEEK